MHKLKIYYKHKLMREFWNGQEITKAKQINFLKDTMKIVGDSDSNMYNMLVTINGDQKINYMKEGQING